MKITIKRHKMRFKRFFDSKYRMHCETLKTVQKTQNRRK